MLKICGIYNAVFACNFVICVFAFLIAVTCSRMESKHASHKEAKRRIEETSLIWRNSKWSCKEGVIWRGLDCRRCLTNGFDRMEDQRRKEEDLEEGELLSDEEI